MAPNRQRKFHAPLPPLAAHKLLSPYLSIYIKLKMSVCLSDGHAAYSPDLARIDIVCADNEVLIIRLL